jgi:hypothetical protein
LGTMDFFRRLKEWLGPPDDNLEVLATTVMVDPDYERSMTLKELSDVLEMPYETLRKAVAQGRIAGRKSGGVWLSSKRAVVQALLLGRIRAWNGRGDERVQMG